MRVRVSPTAPRYARGNFERSFLFFFSITHGKQGNHLQKYVSKHRCSAPEMLAATSPSGLSSRQASPPHHQAVQRFALTCVQLGPQRGRYAKYRFSCTAKRLFYRSAYTIILPYYKYSVFAIKHSSFEFLQNICIIIQLQ